MASRKINPEQFKSYPPEARSLAIAHIALLEQLPETFALLLLREIIAYDWKFPVEREDLTAQLAYLDSLSADERQEVLGGFLRLRLSTELEHFDGVSAPVRYSELLTAHLWATHQIDAFRTAALDYSHRFDSIKTPHALPVPRLGIVIVGQGAATSRYPLFRRLRPHGVRFTRITPGDGVRMVAEVVAARAAAHPVPYGHWYIDGGPEWSVSCRELTAISYSSLEPVRAAILKKMEKVIQSGTGGPEQLRTLLAQLHPEDVGLRGAGSEVALNHFQVSVLAEGSGTQIFSTTFVQWAAREALRRAQPVTLVVRYAPRQRQRAMNELIESPERAPTLDPEGSLVDADMGAYLTWLNQQRLPGAEQASFLVWWEDQAEALAIGPAFPRGTESNSVFDMRQLVSQIV